MRPTYTNPVYNHTFADPFVLKYCGEYWAYCTGAWRDGRWFGVLRSRDLVEWEEVGGALEPLPGGWPCQWAPEVIYHNGRFYLYYSLGDETSMQIRVAVADRPAGPFYDSGRRLTREPFAIDAHVFVDRDGARYLFYATDYLDHSHVGTGTARDRLLDPLTLAGESRPVTRARYDWQVYDPQRAEKGGARWHTLEGPFVLERKGRYYQMFSGGNWQNSSYGVSYAVAERIDRPDEWAQVADGERVLPILRSAPPEVRGPGHNSAVRGPDNRQLFCVYHRWAADGSGRVMAIDPLDWAGERMFLCGPSSTPSPINLPAAADFFDGQDALAWRLSGPGWSAGGGSLVQREAAAARAICPQSPPSYLVEVSCKALAPAAPGGYGIALGDALAFLIEPAAGRALVRHGDGREQPIALPNGFAAEAFHLLRVEVNGGAVSISVDEASARWGGRVDGPAQPCALITDGAPAAFAGFALTAGWADLFAQPGAPADCGWAADGAAPAAWRIAGGALRVAGEPAAALLKGPLPSAYELTVSVAVTGDGGTYSIYPAARPGDLGPALALARRPEGWAISCDGAGQLFPLPAGFDPRQAHQLRLRVAAGRAQIACEAVALGAIDVPAGAYAGLAGVDAAFDSVTVTAIR